MTKEEAKAILERNHICLICGTTMQPVKRHAMEHSASPERYECSQCALEARKREADLIDQAESVYFAPPEKP